VAAHGRPGRAAVGEGAAERERRSDTLGTIAGEVIDGATVASAERIGLIGIVHRLVYRLRRTMIGSVGRPPGRSLCRPAGMCWRADLTLLEV
jgi:hypothetical protein